jgi:hypothetical protein
MDQSSTSTPQQETIDDVSVSMTRKTACMVSRAIIHRRTSMMKDNMTMKTRITPTTTPLVLLLCAVMLTLADIQTTRVVVSSFIHQPPMAFVGTSVQSRLKTKPFDQSSSWASTGSIRASGQQQQQAAIQAAVLQTKLWSSSSSSSSTQAEDVFVEAQDLDALQQLFSKYCDKEGLMSKKNLEQIPAIAQLLVRACCCVRKHDTLL